MVHSNSVRQNIGFGLRLGTTAGYRENVITSGAGVGPVLGGREAGGNVCDGSLTAC